MDAVSRHSSPAPSLAVDENLPVLSSTAKVRRQPVRFEDDWHIVQFSRVRNRYYVRNTGCSVMILTMLEEMRAHGTTPAFEKPQ
jgi:hypothetical protein